MPRAKKTVRKSSAPKSAKAKSNIFPEVKWGESYTSLFLGIVVVVVAAILVFSFIKGRNLTTSTQSTSTATATATPVPTQRQVGGTKMLPKTYSVKAGDDLWSIAEKIYGSGYNWVDLANANKLSDPNVLFSGTNLIVPNVKTRVVTSTVPTTVTQPSITGVTYTVQKGDYLWEIALRAYGDGYKWVDIAKANSLANPDIIHSGNVLKIPR